MSHGIYGIVTMERCSIGDNFTRPKLSPFIYWSGEGRELNMYKEAIEDGIRTLKDGHGDTWYLPHCSICGEEIMSLNYKRGIIYVCKSCKANMKFLDQEIRKEENHDKKEKKYETALNRIAKVVPKKQAPLYLDACDKVHKKLHTSGWFDSTEEIMVAIELLKNGFKIKHHYRVGGRFEVDFVIPSIKVVLEIEGKIFHSNKSKEKLRDEFIKTVFDEDWEIIRIDTDLINQNIKRLVPAINAVLNKRKQLRKENQGELPDWYAGDKLV